MAVLQELVGRVTDAIVEELQGWQKWPFDLVYSVVFLDAIRVQIRDENMVRSKAVHVALDFCNAGSTEVLGL